ncbi:MAG: wax ester/triacylglycerol synthase family O-acyltransferase [Pseudonocardiaceae bacterium]
MRFRSPSDPTVRRLSGLDAGFLSLEMSEQPMQNIALGMLRAGTGGPLTFADLRRHLAAKLDKLPPLRCRVVPLPLGVAHPVFVDDPRFDLADHLHHAALPEPGGPEELGAACAQLASQFLDRDRPLWRITLIDGLADGRQAILLEIHHALMDGFAIRTTLARIFSGEEVSQPPCRPARLPGRMRLVTSALAHDVRALARLPELAGRTRRAAVAVRQRQARAAVRVPKAGVDTPLSVINQGFTPERRFAWVSLPLESLLTVKKIACATVNDVALTLVGGALRGYLQARGALPDRPLVANVPVGMDEPEATPRAEGNRFSCLTTSLATDVADPWERLRRISAVTAESKACLDLMGREMLLDWLEYFPPMLISPMLRHSQVARRRAGKRAAKLDANVVVSNLRGPPVPWRLGSTVVEEMYLAGPPNNGVGVNFALWDYAGRLLFGILSFADSVEDPGELAVRLSHSLDELVAAAERRRGPTT